MKLSDLSIYYVFLAGFCETEPSKREYEEAYMQQEIIETYFPTPPSELPKLDSQADLTPQDEIIEQFLMTARQYLELD